MASPRAPRLPPELLLQVIDSVVPSGTPHIAYPPSSIVTRTLLALTHVSRTTYAAANQNLVRHCLYIHSSESLRLVLLRLSKPNEHTPSLPALDLLPHVGSLYLAPFGRRTIDDLPTAMWVRELLTCTRGTLRRLVIDIPLRSVYPWGDHLNVRPTLRKAFEQLVRLEEFVSVRDELYLDLHDREEGVDEPPVWQSWTRLKRLALYNVDSRPGFWHDVATMESLETLVLTRADGLEDIDFKTEYFSRTNRRLNVKWANIALDHPDQGDIPKHGWREVDKEGRMRVELYDIPVSYYGDEDVIDLCQNWVKDAALRRTLWNWEGAVVKADSSSAPEETVDA